MKSFELKTDSRSINYIGTAIFDNNENDFLATAYWLHFVAGSDTTWPVVLGYFFLDVFRNFKQHPCGGLSGRRLRHSSEVARPPKQVGGLGEVSSFD